MEILNKRLVTQTPANPVETLNKKQKKPNGEAKRQQQFPATKWKCKTADKL